MPHSNAGREHPHQPGMNNDTTHTAAEDGGMQAGRQRWDDWVISIGLGVVLFLFIRTFAIEAFRIPTGSMESTLLAGDFVLVNKAIYGSTVPGTSITVPGFTRPRHGEVIVFVPPHQRDKNYVKRLIGLPGDTVEMHDKVVRVNGTPISEPYAQYNDFADAVTPDAFWQCRFMIHSKTENCSPSRDNWGPIVVPPDAYLVLGDNRDDSEDSRYWGFVQRASILGRPLVVYFSIAHATSEKASWASRVRWRRIGHDVH